jgi:nudix-type nucleoside diphosphatase (YffH/AdpP family)
MQAEIIERKVVYDRWSRITDVLLRMPNGAIERRVVEDHGRAAAVLLYDPERKVALLVRQPRAPVIEMVGEALLEVVAGRLDGKSGAATARAEAAEEAGVRIAALEHVASLWTMPAVSTERLELYLAAFTQADRVAEGGGAADENECIVVEEVPLARLRDMMANGELRDGKTFTLVQALMLRRPDLFA